MRSICLMAASVRSSGPAGPRPTTTTVPTGGPALGPAGVPTREQRRRRGGRLRRLRGDDARRGLLLVEAAELRVDGHARLAEGLPQPVGELPRVGPLQLLGDLGLR